MILFANNSELDARSFQVFGLSSKDQSKIGRFGTGLKYAIATILRGGGEVSIRSGDESFVFTTKPVTFRETEHQAIFCNEEELSYTTSLGRDWQPWMAFRELYSNSLDEDGTVSFTQSPSDEKETQVETAILVNWSAFDAIYFSFEEYFIGPDEEPIFENDGIQIYGGKSKFVFYRGISVHELKSPAAFRYNLKGYVSLTEDRTAQYPWMLEQKIASSLLTCTNESVLTAVTSVANAYEKQFDYVEALEDGSEPSSAFIGAASRNGVDCNQSAANLVEIFAPSTNGDQVTVISPAQPGGQCLLSSIEVLRNLGEDVSKPKWALIPDLKITSDFVIKGDVVMINPACFDNQAKMDEAVFFAFNETRKGNWFCKKLRSLSESSTELKGVA